MGKYLVPVVMKTIDLECGDAEVIAESAEEAMKKAQDQEYEEVHWHGGGECLETLFSKFDANSDGVVKVMDQDKGEVVREVNLANYMKKHPEPVMEVNDFVKKFTIDPNKDIAPHFKKVKEVGERPYAIKGCFNCEDQINQHSLRSAAWTQVQYCWACDSLNVTYVGDKMGGQFDVTHCYQKKEESNG